MQSADAEFRDVLGVALHEALAYLEGLDGRTVPAIADLTTLRRRLAQPLAEGGVRPEQVVSDLVSDVEGGILGSVGGRFYCWAIGGCLPAALAADWLTASWDQNAALYACSPAAAIVEEVAGKWLKEILGLPVNASFAFVTGCQMAHTTCLAAARHALLTRRGWDIEERGLFGAPRIRILSSSERHGSIDRVVRLLGLGASQVSYLTPDSQGRVLYGALKQALDANPSAPTIVLLQAGEFNIGSYDPFDTIIPLCKERGAWVHVDGAFGLWAGASARYKHLVEGVALADSWATDGHKWLNVPFDSGYAFVADAEAHRAAMSHRAAYLTHDAEARDQIDWNPEWSRRARGFPTYAALRQLGRRGIADLVERCCAHAHSLVTEIGRLPGTHVLWEPVINQGLVRFLSNDPQATEDDHDRRTDEVIAAIDAAGEAFFGGTTWRGRRAMRVNVCNWRTTEADVRRAVRSIEKVLENPGGEWR
jgi:glutamate/tyrosine decarboxylase-like PLP-dependent enzyme